MALLPLKLFGRYTPVKYDSVGGGVTNTITGIKKVTGSDGIDSMTNVLIGITYPHHEIHAGDAYCCHNWVDVPANDVLDVRMVTPNTSEWLHLIADFSAEAEFHVSLYRNIAITTAGTAMTPINQNHNSTNTSGLTAFDYIVNADLANANADTNITGATLIHKWILGSGRDIGGETSARDEIVMKQNTGYCFRFESQDGTSTRWVQTNLCWYEHTNKN